MSAWVFGDEPRFGKVDAGIGFCPSSFDLRTVSLGTVSLVVSAPEILQEVQF